MVSQISDIVVSPGTTSGSVSVANTFANSDLPSDETIVQMQTSQGTIDLQLYNTEAPITVQNFLSYVNSGQYNNTLFYRAVQGFVDQTGADYPVDQNSNPINASTPSDTLVGNINTLSNAPTIQNEYSDSRPNVLGTIAMAKVSGNPNSASTEWFINLADNSQNLDNQNGGFTVFGQVIGDGMTVAQTIGNLPTLGSYGASGTYADLPVVNYQSGGNIEAGNLVLVPTVSVVPAISYSVSSSNSAIVNASLNNGNVSLLYGQTGTAQVTVTATDVLGNTQTNTFNVTVQQDTLSVTHNGSGVFSAQSSPINFGYAAVNGTDQQTLVITNNSTSPLSLSSFSVPASFRVVGDEPTTIAAGASANLVLAMDTSSPGAESGTLTFDTTDPATPTFSVNLSGTVGYSAVIGTASSTKAKTFTFTDADGTLTTVTLNGPGTMTPYFFSNTAVSQTAGKKGISFSGTGMLLQDLELDSTTAKSSLTITSKGGDGATTIQNLDITGAINVVTGKGVQFTGGVSFTTAKTINVAVANAADFTGQSLSTLDLSGNSNLSVDLTGALGSVSARGSLIGTWNAATLGKLSAAALNGFNLTTGGTVSSISSKGAITNSTLMLASAKTISAASMSGDKIQAGYSASAFPPTASSVTAADAIMSLNNKGAFSNTDIVAGSLGSISLGIIDTSNGGTTFGVAGDTLKSLTGKVNGKAIKLAKLNSSNSSAPISALGSLGDFKIDIL